MQSKYVQWLSLIRKNLTSESRPVEVSWKSGRVRWMEDFLPPGLTSILSAIGILLLSSVSLQHTQMKTCTVQYKDETNILNIEL